MRTLIIALCCLPVAAVASTTVSVSQLTVDGLELRDIHCDLSSGGFFASMAVAGALASKKAELDACQPDGAAVRATWTWQDGQTHNATAELSKPAQAGACVAQVLGQVQSSLSGSCRAVVLVGDATAAAALLPLQPPDVDASTAPHDDQ